jgi:hypothetical protein
LKVETRKFIAPYGQITNTKSETKPDDDKPKVRNKGSVYYSRRPLLVRLFRPYGYKIRLNHRRESSAETSAATAAAAANSALISMSFFSSKNRLFKDS